MVTTHELHRRITQEHHSLRVLQEDMLAAFEIWCQDPNSKNQKDLSRIFHDFAETLERHFDFEEDGGYLNVVTERRPHHSAQVDRLLDDHEQIRRMNRRLRTDMQRDLSSEDDTVRLQIRKEFVGLFSLFGRHEQAERELVMEVFWLEGGYSS